MYLDEQTDGRTEKWTNIQIDKQKKALRMMDRQVDEHMDTQIDNGQTDG